VWTFGDGTTVVGAQVSHTYARPGLYTVRVVATDALGNATVERFRVRVGGGVDDHRSR
jgi:PKD repeat protein